MKKLNLKSILSLFLLFFLSFGCEQQVDVPEKLTAAVLLKDNDFLDFMETAEEVRYKVLRRQSDWVIFAEANGVRKPDFSASLKNADNSLEKVRQWGSTKESAIQNKILIVKELGFTDWNEYEQLEEKIAKKRSTLTAKYPVLLTMSVEDRRELLAKVVKKWENIPNTKISTGGWNVLCTNCFFNNCNSCGTGEGKHPNDPWAGGSGPCEKLNNCLQNARNKKEAQLNQARALYVAELVLCGADGLAAGGTVMAGTVMFPPASVLAGTATALGVSVGCLSLVTYIYSQRSREIQADYNHMVMECESMFPC